MAVNWSEPKIEKEKVKIEPEVFVEEAKKYTETGDFNMAERAYVNALSNARGSSNIKDIIRIVKEGLSEIYLLWTQDCINQYKYQEAEPVLRKLVKISDDKRAAQEEYIKLYDAWGLSLSLYDNNVNGAIIIFAKKLRLEKKLEHNTEVTETKLISLLYSSKNAKYRKVAEKLQYSKMGARVRLLLSALIMAGVALATPLYAPNSILIYVFSFFMLVLRNDWELQGLVLYKKRLWKCIGLTFFSLTWFIILMISVSSSNWRNFDTIYTVMSIITFVILTVISIRVMFYAIGQFKVYFSYKKVGSLDAIGYILAPINISCKSCGAKLRISDETISAVKCPKCGNIAREAMELRIKNIPSHSSDQAEGGQYDPKVAWGRVGGLGAKLVVREIFRNIRF